MINIGESDLICDFAETYHIYDYKVLPLRYLATLASGLRDDSRIKMKLASVDVSYDTLMLASILDCVRWLVWTKTKDGEKNINKPSSILDILVNDTKNEDEIMSFNSPIDFEKAKQKFMKEG